MSAHILHFDPCKKLVKRFAQWQREVDERAAQAARTAEQLKFAAAYGERHPAPDSGLNTTTPV